jgi:hypothetical protein
MQLEINKNNQYEVPDIWIAQKNKHKIACLNGINSLKLSFFLNDINTCSFTIPRIVKNKLNNGYDSIEPKMLVLIVGFGWYELSVSIKNDGGYEVKEVTGKALESELQTKQIYNLEVNAADIEYDDYVVVKFYDPTNPSASLLHKVLDTVPTWTIGHVDEDLWIKQRSFSIDNQDIYSFLTGDVAEAFECFFIFDSFSRTVNAYVLENYGRNTNIYTSLSNLNNSVSVEVDDTKIITVYRVVGGEGIYINEVNPNGTDLIYDLSYYLDTKYMLQSTIDSYNNYKTAYNTNYEPYQAIMAELQGYVDTILNLQNKTPTDPTSTDWTQYGLTQLEDKQKQYENTCNDYITARFGTTDSPSYTTLYLPAYNTGEAIKAEIIVRKNQISAQETLRDNAIARRDAIQDILNIRNYFTYEGWQDVSNYFFIGTYSNDNYITTSIESDSERMATERALFNVASEELSKVARPQYSFTTNTNNPKLRKEFKPIVDGFELGNFIYVEVNEDYIAKMRLIGYTLDFDNIESIDVTYSDMISTSDYKSDIKSVLAQATSTSISVNSSKKKWNEAYNEGNYVYQMRKEGLNAALFAINNSDKQEVVVDEKGITGREFNDESQTYNPEQYRLVKNILAFTDDDWKTVRSVFGKITLNGVPCYGLIADALISNINISNVLKVSNTNNSITMDENGASFYNCGIVINNGLNTITLDAINGFEILKGTTSIVGLDINGDAYFKGKITGGSLNINDNCIITADGLLTANSANIIDGTFTGTLTSAAFNGGSININNKFTVDSEGYFTSTSGKIGGWNIGVNELNNHGTDASFKLFYGDNKSMQINRLGLHVFNRFSGNDEYLGGIVSSYFSTGTYCGMTLIQPSTSDYISIGYSDMTSPDDNIDTAIQDMVYTHNGFTTDDGHVEFQGFNFYKPLYIYGIAVSTADHTHTTLWNYSSGCGAYVSSNGNFASTAQKDLGASGAQWGTVYLASSPVVSSDKNAKNSISELDYVYKEIILKLKPVKYKYNNGTSNRWHTGFIAQDVENLLMELGITTNDFAGLIKSPVYEKINENGEYDITSNIINYIYSLRYEEFISPITSVIQELKEEIRILKENMS